LQFLLVLEKTSRIWT